MLLLRPNCAGETPYSIDLANPNPILRSAVSQSNVGHFTFPPASHLLGVDQLGFVQQYRSLQDYNLYIRSVSLTVLMVMMTIHSVPWLTSCANPPSPSLSVWGSLLNGEVATAFSSGR